MNERLATLEVADEETLAAAFKRLQVRSVGFGDFIGAGRVSSVVPTARSWRAGTPQALGASIRSLMGEDETGLRVYSLNDQEAILRREESKVHPFGRSFTKKTGTDHIHHARITEVIDMPVGWGRVLPLLRLEEFNNPPPDQDFVISVAEMARHVHDKVVGFELG